MRKPSEFPRLEYFGTSLTGAEDARYTREQDNPLSEAFVPLEERDGLGQARFWAAAAAKSKMRAGTSELDEPGGEM